MIQKGDVVGLSYHVDYWNYLGWTDSLASKENTERQYGYMRALGRNGVYTPQAILNGRDHVKGADVRGIYDRLDSFKREGKGLNVPVSSKFAGDEVEIDIGAGSGKADVVVAYFTPAASSNGSLSSGRWRCSPKSCCSMSRPLRWTPR